MAVVVVTGCSSGFGEALARGFADHGDTVVATMRRPPASGPLYELGQQPGSRVSLLPLDVVDAGSRAAAVEAVMARYGRIDVLVNNAGVLRVGSVEDVPEQVAREVFETNYFGAVALTNAVVPVLRRQGSGRIVNVTAIGAVLSTPFLSSYCASKHAMDALSACLDIELRPFGIRVSSILPGSFRTSIGRQADAVSDSPPYQSSAAAFREGFLGRLASAPDDFSELVAAAVDAATAVDPRARYVVGGGAAESIRPLVGGLARLHQAEVERVGLAR